MISKSKFFVALFATVAATLGGAGVAFAAPITLAENVHVNSQGNGNNHYSSSSSIGAENFSLSGTYNILNISHVGHHDRFGPIQPLSIDWWIYAGGAGAPGAALFSGNTSSYATAIEGTSGSYDLTRYSIALSGVTLSAGNYWVGFHNNVNNQGDPHWTFASSGTSFDGISALSTNLGGSWGTPYPGGNMTFRVIGEQANVVPEPGMLALVGVAMVGFGVARRKKQAAA